MQVIPPLDLLGLVVIQIAGSGHSVPDNGRGQVVRIGDIRHNGIVPNVGAVASVENVILPLFFKVDVAEGIVIQGIHRIVQGLLLGLQRANELVAVILDDRIVGIGFVIRAVTEGFSAVEHVIFPRVTV